MKKKDILSVCLMISILGSISVGCSSISNPDEGNLDLGTSTTYDTSVATTLEDTQTSEIGTISLSTVAMATNPVTESITSTTTLNTASTTKPATTTSQVTTTSVKATTAVTTTQGTTSWENTLPISFDLVAMTKDENALPPLNDELKNLFEKAFTAYCEFTGGGTIKIDAFDTITLNDKSYSKVIDNRFSSVDEVTSYLSQYFTQDFIDSSYILDSFTYNNGELYTSLDAKGFNIQYCGHTFEVTDQTSKEIDFQADVYFCTETWNEDYYFINKTPTVDYTTQISKYVLIKTDNGWRFDTFSRIY